MCGYPKEAAVGLAPAHSSLFRLPQLFHYCHQGGLKFLKFLIRAGSMVNKKVIQLVIKIFTWFDKKRISKIKIKFGNEIELSRILKRFNIQGISH